MEVKKDNRGLKFTGSWVALITPFTEDDRVDMDGFRRLVDFHVNNETSGLIFMGSTGEPTSLSMAERKEIITEMADYCKGKVPAIFGVTSPTTKQTIELAQHVERAGGEGILLTLPSYIIPPRTAALKYLMEVARSVSVSVAVYNNPGRVVTNIDPEMIESLSEIENVVAVKEASPSMTQLMGVISVAKRKGLYALCCDSPKFGLIMPLLSMGGHGTANVTGNIIPREMAQLSKPWETAEDMLTSRKLFFDYKPLMEAAYSITNPIAIKSAVGLLGLPAGKPRTPLMPLEGEKLDEMKRLIEKYGLRERYGL